MSALPEPEIERAPGPGRARRDARDSGGEPERRAPRDRRARPTPFFSRYWLWGRRRGARRACEPQPMYVDRVEPRDGWMVLGILLACIADLALTLDYLRQGGEEWNPVMLAALRHGEGAFITAKLGLTVLGLLVVMRRARFRGMRRVLAVVLALYVLLLGWHAVVRAGFPDPGPAEASGSALQEQP